ncbi:LysR family transcriptional regulator [Lichenicoccus sp.]|uniref:LysR family transcriptional regulator n=1 Tax=Lichenicoccus sp. TaxID=2781899 RepID=UPI003D0CD344
MDLPALADFNLVATHGGFSQASRISGRPKATLARRVGALEIMLGVRLLERSSRGLQLTQAGVRLQERVGPLLAELAQAAEGVGTEGPPRGRLRVSAPTLLSDTVLGPIAVSFAQAYPEVSLEITAENRMAELPADGYDLVIRVDPGPRERLVGRCVLRDERWLIAAPGFPRPTKGAADPPALPVIVHVPPTAGAVWTVCEGGRTLRFSPRAVLRLSSLPMQRAAVLVGGGAALLPRSLVAQDVSAGRLVCWGVESGAPAELWALHTSRRLVDPKVTAFVRHLTAALAGSAT